MAEQHSYMKVRLSDLEKTVVALNGQLKDMQRKLQQANAGSLTGRFRNHFLCPWQGGKFMSAVCSQHVRPNTKVVDHAGLIRH